MIVAPRAAMRTFLVSVAASLLVACATKAPPPPVPQAALHPHSIAIIPVLRAEDLTINRRSMIGALGALPLVIERMDRLQKQKTFETQLESNRVAVARAMTEAIRAAAQRRGFEVAVLDNVQRDPEDPDDFDYRRIETEADIVVHVRVSDIGLLNPTWAIDYEPYVDAKVRFVAHTSGYEMLDENFYYGVNGSKNDPYSVPSDANDRWSDFDTVMASSDAVGRSWIKGAGAGRTDRVETPRAVARHATPVVKTDRP